MRIMCIGNSIMCIITTKMCIITCVTGIIITCSKFVWHFHVNLYIYQALCVCYSVFIVTIIISSLFWPLIHSKLGSNVINKAECLISA